MDKIMSMDKFEQNEKRVYKKFTTSLDEEIIKELKVGAIKSECSVAQVIEHIWRIVTGIDRDIIDALSLEAEKENIKVGEVINRLYRERNK